MSPDMRQSSATTPGQILCDVCGQAPPPGRLRDDVCVEAARQAIAEAGGQTVCPSDIARVR